MKLSHMVQGYLETAHFADCPDDHPLFTGSGKYQRGDIGTDVFTKDAIKRAEKDCAAFLSSLSEEAANLADSWDGGGDLWYTRNHHGVGFWEADRGWGEYSQELTDKAHAMGECHVVAARKLSLY